MSEDENASPGEAAKKPKVRRISSKAPRKTGEKATDKDSSPEAPENEAAGAGPESGKPEQKRGNRRRRGKGKPSGQESGQEKASETQSAVETEDADDGGADSVKTGNHPSPREQPQKNHRPEQKPRRKLDPEKVAKNAWKIYLSEVSEEGVALIGDNDARELARRCFRLSEIFLEEEERRN